MSCCPAPNSSSASDANSNAAWLAIYTRSNHERTVAAALTDRAVRNYLPTYMEVHQWSDRKKTLELPLFPNYVFAQIDPRQRVSVLRCPGVLGIVSNGSADAAIPDEEVTRINRVLRSGLKVQPSPYLQRGHRVILSGGPLKGLEGVVIRQRGNARLVVAVDMLERAMSVDVDMAWVKLAESFLSPSLQAIAEQLRPAPTQASPREKEHRVAGAEETGFSPGVGALGECP